MTLTDFMRTMEVFDLIRVSKLLRPSPVIGIHSGWDAQGYAIKSMFSDANVIKIGIDDWDITSEKYKPANSFDLLCFFCVFHYIAEPANALSNVLSNCRYLLIQDLIIRDRSADIFGNDGDCMRFSYGDFKSNYKEAFDLSVLKYRMLFFTPYVDNATCLHFITLIKGDLWTMN